jgi:pyruvate dehydrogenase E1 component
LTGPALRERFTDGAPAELVEFIRDIKDEDLYPLVTDLGGHDVAAMLTAFDDCDKVVDRPSVVFAYTVKGWGLPTAGNPRNHSALLNSDQIAALRASVGLDASTEWDPFEPAAPAGILSNARRIHLTREPRNAALAIEVPHETGVRSGKPLATQEAFGRVLVDLSRNDAVAPYLVTTAPDVATSTNLAGFINRTGVFSPTERRSWNEDPVLKWAEGPSGQHIELGISEMNLFLLLGQLGLSWDLSDQPLLPIGTVYDPFVCRGLDAFIHSTYSGARFVIAGTPSGITLAPEGGAHQSTITASIGLELPGVTFVEPTYAGALDWLLCDALGRIAHGPSSTPTAAPYDDGAYYFRLTTRPIDQGPFDAARRRIGDAILRRQVLAGGYRLVDAFEAHPELVGGDTPAPLVHLVSSGAVMPEVLLAAEELADEGVAAHVVDVTSLDRLYSAWQRTLRQGVRTATTPSVPGALRAIFPEAAPIVTIHDAASHAMAWLGSALGVPGVPLGVDSFGQSGSVHDLYEMHDLLPGSIVNAALASLELMRR